MNAQGNDWDDADWGLTGPRIQNDVQDYERIYNQADIARELGVSDQAIRDRFKRGTLPPWDFLSANERPLWMRSTLVQAGVLPPKPAQTPSANNHEEPS